MSSQGILIVDDWPDIRKLAGSYLQSFGYEIFEVKNGTQAIQNAITENPRLILLDLWLPDMHGVEVARSLRRLPNTAHIPIVGWTVDIASKPPQKQLLSAGFVHCLEKPFSLAVLETVVQAFVPKPQR